MHYFYMIRRLETKTYYHQFLIWTDMEKADIWWGNQGLKEVYKTFERLRVHWQCAIVKFKVEEMKCHQSTQSCCNNCR